MNIEGHWERVRESIAVIDECIEKGLVKRQRSIGFNASAAAADLLEILLHKNNLIDPGFVIKHEWFKSKNKVIDKFPFDFPHKTEILDLVFRIEDKRNALCYGKPQKIEVIQEVIIDFNKLKELFQEEGSNEL